LSEDEIRKMRDEAKANAESDRLAKEKADKLNSADSMIFSTEKQLKEFGDKLPADKKAAIESALARLKDAHRSQDISAIDKALADLNSVWQTASEEMYKTAQNTTGQQSSQSGQDQPGNGKSKGGSDEVTDVDFEEVK
jgi:molecular chaperone DnaK